MKHVDRRVVVTGLGAITPIGLGAGALWENATKGVSGVDRITHFDASEHPTKIAAEVKGFNAEDWVGKKNARRMDPFTQYALAGAQLAIEDSGLDLEKEDPSRIGVIVSSGIGGMSAMEREIGVLLKSGPRRISPFFIPTMISDIAAGQISIRYGLTGPNYATTSACASSSNSLGDAFRLIQRGDTDIMVAGGSEAAITAVSVGGFNAMKALSTRNDEPKKASRPFDQERDGFVMGEGSGIVILESLDHARSRGATIYAELVGVAYTADAYHITAPAPGGEGGVRAMRLSLQDAGVNPEEVDYINAHGTSTETGDKNETAAIKTVFGDHAYRLKVSSSKSMVGHLLGASGGVEFIICVLSIQNDTITPTINYEHPDPECDLNYVPNESIQQPVRVAISNSFGFGGHNVCLVVRKFDG